MGEVVQDAAFSDPNNNQSNSVQNKKNTSVQLWDGEVTVAFMLPTPWHVSVAIT
jgi:hypothetical protein